MHSTVCPKYVQVNLMLYVCVGVGGWVKFNNIPVS